MADSAAHGDQASHLAAAAGWIEDSGDPALALWCDGRVLEPPVQKVWDSESGDFVFEEKRPSATGLPDWHVPPDATLNPEMPVVPVVSVGVGASDWIRPYLDQAHFDAVVVEAYAAGDVQPELADAIRSVVRSRRPVVLASRSRPGYVKAKFPGVAGASDELLRSGVLSAGALEPNLARLRLALSLALTPPVTPQTAFVTNDSEGQC
jgi:L-asparaginase/Glu-tRNA(Gln) amidotransferase subunit D